MIAETPSCDKLQEPELQEAEPKEPNNAFNRNKTWQLSAVFSNIAQLLSFWWYVECEA